MIAPQLSKKLISEGICHPNGYFFGTFCHAGGKMSCYCQLAGGATPKLYTSTVGNDVYQINDHATVEIEIASEGGFSSYTNFMGPLAICGAAFGMGYYFSNKKNNGYKPLLDGKKEVEMQ